MKTFKGTVADLNEFVEDLKCEIEKNDLYVTENEEKPFHDGYFFKIYSEIEYGIYYCDEIFEKALKKWL